MLTSLLLGVLIGGITTGGATISDCKKLDFQPKACWQAEQVNKALVFGCKIQGKEYVGNAPGNHNGCSK